ncbi:PP2C family serine/threonine-protein phosphatase [Nocardiopsis sp. RSe5-2]|uniref:PP2C family serine/threonine-protein phosphatase n=1 Tax=Nocardiopsis endophytica TaxID=3018445 RepID=A0ABT4U097_9ACTN|nr:PP2C family serine/threonine-protein phosphatase [Nocardiopsis endophytica]MDA2810369.1 PP2C family serine/threonine-protein phosphatase [Nocardiopsis endophytica]
MITTALATRRGSRAFNCDAASIHTRDSATAAALIDGIGNDEATATTARLLAETVARVTAHRGGLAGLLSGTQLLQVDQAGDAVGVAALASPGSPTWVWWSGDCRGHGFDHQRQRLRRFTSDHTVGEQLRRNGAPWELAADHDNWVQTPLSEAAVATVYDVEVPVGELVVLTSDGVHDYVAHEELEEMAAALQDSPQDLAQALVDAARPDEDGYRDDATAVVLAPAAGKCQLCADAAQTA